MNQSIEKKIDDCRKMAQMKKDFIKSIKEENAREWEKIQNESEAVYLYHSCREESFPKKYGLKCRKVTVAGIVKKEEDGTYTLTIAWAKCHTNDNYDRKMGNLIAARRAFNGQSFVVFSDSAVKPMVLSGFSTPVLKNNFMPIAASIVDIFEDYVDVKTKEVSPVDDSELMGVLWDEDFERPSEKEIDFDNTDVDINPSDFEV